MGFFQEALECKVVLEIGSLGACLFRASIFDTLSSGFAEDFVDCGRF